MQSTVSFSYQGVWVTLLALTPYEKCGQMGVGGCGLVGVNGCGSDWVGISVVIDVRVSIS